MERILKVGAYCRVSTEKEEQQNSLENQKQYFEQYIRSHDNWSLVKIYYDEGISGTQTKTRAGFNEMLRDAFHGKLDLILTKEVSRFARNTVDALSCTRRLAEAGVGVHFTIDHIDTRETDGELRLTLMASIAQEESRKTSERVKWGQRRRMEQGIVFGRELYGYHLNKGKLTICEKEAEIIRRIFLSYRYEQKGPCQIAKELNQENIPTKNQKQWSASSVRRILRNEKYAGDLCQKKTYTPNFLTHQKKYNHGEEEKICITNHHTPIIERSLWDDCEKIRLQRAIPPSGKPSPPANSFLYCGICGKHCLKRTKKRNDQSKAISFHCPEGHVCVSEEVIRWALEQLLQTEAFFPELTKRELKKELQALAEEGLLFPDQQKLLQKRIHELLYQKEERSLCFYGELVESLWIFPEKKLQIRWKGSERETILEYEGTVRYPKHTLREKARGQV